MPPLKTILRANAASCLLFGALFVLFPEEIARFLSVAAAPGWLILGVGLILLGNAGHLLWVAASGSPRRWEVLYFTGGDLAWVLITLVLILSSTWITTPGGIAAALGVAVVVGGFALGQITALAARRQA
jgi:hypothetical protein